MNNNTHLNLTPLSELYKEKLSLNNIELFINNFLGKNKGTISELYLLILENKAKLFNDLLYIYTGYDVANPWDIDLYPFLTEFFKYLKTHTTINKEVIKKLEEEYHNSKKSETEERIAKLKQEEREKIAEEQEKIKKVAKIAEEQEKVKKEIDSLLTNKGIDTYLKDKLKIIAFLNDKEKAIEILKHIIDYSILEKLFDYRYKSRNFSNKEILVSTILDINDSLHFIDEIQKESIIYILNTLDTYKLIKILNILGPYEAILLFQYEKGEARENLYSIVEYLNTNNIMESIETIKKRGAEDFSENIK